MRAVPLIVVVPMVAFFACGEPADSFDREPMLTSLVDVVMRPTYADAAAAAATLEGQASTFCAGETTHDELVNSFEEALVRFKLAESFAIGPHTDSPPRLGPLVDAWPAEEADVEALLASSDALDPMSFELRGNRVQGFAALDYLISGDETTLGAFRDESGALRRCDYVVGSAGRIRAVMDQFVTAWGEGDEGHGGELAHGGGRYGGDIATAASVLIEQMVYTIENARELKVGKPFGKRDEGVLQPEQLEVPYGEHGLASVRAALISARNVYRGEYENAEGTLATGMGIRAWLLARNPDLDPVVEEAFADAITSTNAIQPSLEQALSADAATVEAAYQAIKELQLVLAVDMAAALSVTVTFNPTDGD